MKSFMAVETSYHIQITYLEEVTIPYAELGNPNNAQTVIYTLWFHIYLITIYMCKPEEEEQFQDASS